MIKKPLFTPLIVCSLVLAACSTSPMQRKTHAIRLKPGEELKKSLQQFVAEKNIKAGWMITAAGSLTQYSLRFANQPAAASGKGHF